MSKTEGKWLAQAGATTGQILIWNGNTWTPGKLSDYGLEGDLGSLYISSPAGKAITAGVPAIIGGTTTAIKNKNFTHTNQRLTYTGTVPKTFQATATISAKSSLGNIILSIFLAKNGVVVAESEMTRKLATANDVGSAAILCVDDCVTDDYVEVWVDVSSDSTITFDKMVLTIVEI